MRNNDDVGNGDVFETRNQDEFTKFVLESTEGLGVHFMMADGVSTLLISGVHLFLYFHFLK